MTPEELTAELAAHRLVFGVAAPKRALPIDVIEVPMTATTLVNDHAIAMQFDMPVTIVSSMTITHSYSTDQPVINTGLALSAITEQRPTSTPVRPAWVKLARMLQHELRHGYGGQVRNDYRALATYRPADEDEKRACTWTADTGDVQEDYELAEALSSMLADRLPTLARLASGEPPQAPKVRCPQCDVASGLWCQPMHEGERQPGGWQHPGRHAMAEGRAPSLANVRALELARMVLADHKANRAQQALAHALIYGAPDPNALLDTGRTRYDSFMHGYLRYRAPSRAGVDQAWTSDVENTLELVDALKDEP